MNIHLDHVITQIVESFLERGNRKECMLFHININGTCYLPDNYVQQTIEKLEKSKHDIDYDEISSIDIFNMLTFIIFRPANYTKVIYNIATKPMFFNHQPFVFHHSSYHDSCWRTDGIANPISSLQRTITKIIEEEYAFRLRDLNKPEIKFYTQLEKIEKCNCIWVNDCHNLNTGLHPYTYNVHKDFNNNQLVMEFVKNDE